MRDERAASNFSKVFAGVAAVAATLLAGGPANAQWAPPPAEVIATMEPVYFEGHAAYWYGSHWYYRDAHGGWGHYDSEPRELREHRDHSPPVRRSWGHRR